LLAALRSIITLTPAASQCLIRKSILNLCSMIGCGRHSDGLWAKRPILLWQSRPSSGHSVQNSDAGRLDAVSSSKFAHPMEFVTPQQSPVLIFCHNVFTPDLLAGALCLSLSLSLSLSDPCISRCTAARAWEVVYPVMRIQWQLQSTKMKAAITRLIQSLDSAFSASTSLSLDS
jgi:hypothetical protein